MRNGSARTGVLTIVALAVAAVLLSCTYAFAAPASRTQPIYVASTTPRQSKTRSTADPGLSRSAVHSRSNSKP